MFMSVSILFSHLQPLCILFDLSLEKFNDDCCQQYFQMEKIALFWLFTVIEALKWTVNEKDHYKSYKL